jgi:lambda family phage tail tape measure protein
MDAARADWTNGLRSSLANYLDQAGDVAGQSAQLFTSAFNGMSDSLANFATTGKLNFKSLVASILSDLAKMEMRIAVSKILQQVLGAFMGGASYGGGSGAASGTGAYSGFGSSGTQTITYQADGGVFTSPSLSAYSG